MSGADLPEVAPHRFTGEVDIFWWAIVIIAVLSVLALGAGLAVIVPVRNALRRRQQRLGYYADPFGARTPPQHRPPGPHPPPGGPGRQ